MNLAKTLVMAGGLLLLLGLVVGLASRVPGLDRLGRLPGDIRVERENFRFYFPWVTCLLLSLVASLVVRLFGGMK
jgi:hypothetical protein